MRRSYGRANSVLASRKQKVYDRRTSPAELDRRSARILSGAIGTLVMVTMLVGWLLSQIIGSQRNELVLAQAVHGNLKQANDKLVAERNSLLREERLATATVKLGLYPPHDSQSRKAL